MLLHRLFPAREAGTSLPLFATTLSLVGAMCVVSCPALAVDHPLFTAPYVTYDTGGSPASAAVADMNRDGFQDLVVANRFPGSISILYGDGTGGFGDRAEVAVGTPSCFVTVADLDANGALDLVVANCEDNSVSILLGNGDGTFASRTDFPTAASPAMVAIGDLNLDGWQDLAVAASGVYPAYDGRVSVLLGDGTGRFGDRTDYPVDSSAVWVAIGDLNDDQSPDLAVANWYSLDFSVLIANGDGTFAPRTDYNLGGFPSSLAIEDWSGDGKADLAVAVYGSGVQVQLGNGDGSLQEAVHYGTGERPQTLTAGDLNGDGFRDLVVANVFANSATILMGKGNGTFGETRQINLPYSPQGLAIGELNGDGHPDLVFAHGSISTVVSVVLSNGNGALASSTPTYLTAGPVSVAAGDLNGDGFADVAAATIGYDFDDNEIGAVEIRFGNGDGTFRSGTSYPTAHAPGEVVIADLNGDGRLDLAVANGVLSVFLGRGDGTFPPRSDIASGQNAWSLAIGDMNGDGKPDIVTAGQGSTPYITGQLSVYLGNGDGSFGPPSSFETGRGPRSVIVGDLNGDAKLDVVTADYGYGVGSDSVSILLGHGDGTFGPRSAHLAARFPTSVAMGDLDGDGKPDLAVVGEESRSVSVLRGGGDGTFLSRVDYGPMGSELAQVSIADLDMNGRLDLIVAESRYSATVSVRLGKPGGVLGDRIGYGIGEGLLHVAIADLNGDAMPDLVVSNQDQQRLSVLKNLAQPTTSTLLAFFQAAWLGERIEVRWQYRVGSSIAATTLERAVSPGGPWTQIVGALHSEGSADVLVDGGVEPGRSYWYRLVARLANGELRTLGPVSTTGEPRVAEFGLLRIAPNPADGPIRLLFVMPHSAQVRISVFDVMGRRTAVLVNGTLPAGSHEVGWEATGGGAPARAGLYFVRFEWPGGDMTRRVAIVEP